MEEDYDFIKKAQESLDQAQEALFKPQEDIVSFVACKNSQHAILNYLKGFLEKKGFETHNHETIKGLFKRCRSIEPRFNQIKIDIIDCRGKEIDDNYCINVNKLEQCHSVADQLDTLIRHLKIT
ncbi:HEPN domain-containing protein [Namhaeicola litoreus]|uniref:HEPN domain-containing protein n=1 Tax=Namhaeicola litoreus TaxID=1052145 RepID=A0ABW3XXY0_9FLAO